MFISNSYFSETNIKHSDIVEAKLLNLGQGTALPCHSQVLVCGRHQESRVPLSQAHSPASQMFPTQHFRHRDLGPRIKSIYHLWVQTQLKCHFFHVLSSWTRLVTPYLCSYNTLQITTALFLSMFCLLVFSWSCEWFLPSMVNNPPWIITM